MPKYKDRREAVDLQAIGRRIAQEREECGLSQHDLARMTGLTHTSIWYIEHGKNSMSLNSIALIAEALKKDLPYLVYGARRGKPKTSGVAPT